MKTSIHNKELDTDLLFITGIAAIILVTFLFIGYGLPLLAAILQLPQA